MEPKERSSLLTVPPFSKIYDDILSNIYEKKDASQNEEAAASNLNVLALKLSRKKFCDVATFYSFVTRCLDEFRGDTVEQQSKDKLLEELSESLSLIQLRSHTELEYRPLQSSQDEDHSNDSETLSLFDIDLTPFETKAKLAVRKEHRMALAEVLGRYIEEDCSSIIGFSNTEDEQEDVASDMEAVVSKVETMKSETSSKRVAVARHRRSNLALLVLVFDQMIEYCGLLYNLATKHRFSDYNLVHLECSTVLMKAYSLKLRCMELDILNRFYNDATIPSLQALSTEVLRRAEIYRNELDVTNEKLSDYSLLDAEFQTLLKDYATLQRDLKFFEQLNHTEG